MLKNLDIMRFVFGGLTSFFPAIEFFQVSLNTLYNRPQSIFTISFNTTLAFLLMVVSYNRHTSELKIGHIFWELVTYGLQTQLR